MPSRSPSRPRRARTRNQSSAKRSSSSGRWLARQRRDPYVRAAKADKYRGRAAYKLLDIAQRYSLFDAAHGVLDLGAAPGSWCQVARALAPADCKIMGIDKDAMTPLPGVSLLRYDVWDETLDEHVTQYFPKGVCVLLSDMAPAHSGVSTLDHARQLDLASRALDLAQKHVITGGHICLKVLQGRDLPDFVANLCLRFRHGHIIKPAASRAQSAELYLLGLERKI